MTNMGYYYHGKYVKGNDKNKLLKKNLLSCGDAMAAYILPTKNREKVNCRMSLVYLNQNINIKLTQTRGIKTDEALMYNLEDPNYRHWFSKANEWTLNKAAEQIVVDHSLAVFGL